MAKAAGQQYTPLEFSISNSQGKFTFQDFEIPTHLDYVGADQIVVRHQFPGGRIDLQTFGGIPQSIQWSGIILGPNSFEKSLQLKALARFNGASTLVFGPFKYLGVFKSFQPSPHFEGFVAYSARFEPSDDQSQQATPVVATVNQTQATAAAISDTLVAVAQARTSINPAIIQNAANLETTVEQVQNALTNGNPATLLPQLTTQATVQLNYLQTSTDLDNAVLVLAMYTATASLIQALSFIAPPNYTVLSIDSPNLFLLGCRYYGTADGWVTISEANGGLPPFNEGPFNLIIPLTITTQ